MKTVGRSTSLRWFACLRVSLIPLLGMVCVSHLSAAKKEWIAISAGAQPYYVRAVDAAGKPLPETYVFTEGQFMGGGTVDGSLSRLTFDDITKMLVHGLARQNYFPTKDVPSANLVIRVHWGTTEIYEDPQKQFIPEAINSALNEYKSNIEANGIADAGDLNHALNQQAGAQFGEQGAIQRNAVLLGYKYALEKERRKIVPSAEEMTMSHELNEERYFVVLMAYDYQYMQKEHKPRLLWVTRLSVRSPGNNFTEAMPALAMAGAEVFGRQVDGLVRVKAPLQRGQVKLHELQILGTEKALPPAESGK